MKRKDVTKTFMMISNCKPPFGPLVFFKKIQRFNPKSAELICGKSSQPKRFFQREIITNV